MQDGEIIEPNKGGHSIDVHSLPVEALQGILRKLNEKSHSVTKLFRKNYRVRIEDIRQLIQKIDQEFHFTTKISQSVSVALILSENERYDFRSWREFEEFDTSQAATTSSLQVEMIYDIVRVQGEAPERYSMQVSIQNLEGQMGIVFGAFAITEPGRFPVPPAPISATVTFKNYILGKNVLSTIDSWVGALDTNEIWVLEKLQRYSDKLAHGVFFFATLSGIGLAASLITVYPDDVQGWLVISASVVFVFSFFGHSLGRYAERNIDRVRYDRIISFTRGDKNSSNSIRKRNIRHLVKGGLAIILFLMQVIAGVWADEVIPSLGGILGIFGA